MGERKKIVGSNATIIIWNFCWLFQGEHSYFFPTSFLYKQRKYILPSSHVLARVPNPQFCLLCIKFSLFPISFFSARHLRRETYHGLFSFARRRAFFPSFSRFTVHRCVLLLKPLKRWSGKVRNRRDKENNTDGKARTNFCLGLKVTTTKIVINIVGEIRFL